MAGYPFKTYPSGQEVPQLDEIYRDTKKTAIVLPFKSYRQMPLATMRELVFRNTKNNRLPQLLLETPRGTILGEISVSEKQADGTESHQFTPFTFIPNTGAQIAIQCINASPDTLKNIMMSLYDLNPHFNYTLSEIKTELNTYSDISIEPGEGQDTAPALKPFLEALEGRLNQFHVDFCANTGKGATQSVAGSRLGISTDSCDMIASEWFLAQLRSIQKVSPSFVSNITNNKSKTPQNKIARSLANDVLQHNRT